MSKIGILAYGSLIWCPGGEIEAVILRRLKNVKTPFKVEFAGCSKKRGCAPTLIPVEKGGAQVEGVIFVLKEHVSLEEAKHMLWKRESNFRYNPQRIKEISHFHKIDTVIYISFEPCIANSKPRELAELAIGSVRSTKKEKNRDGITYLIEAKRNGIKTRKMDKYEEKIKSLTGTKSLEDALEKLQSE